jgi:GT2 family glycosyltransferase/glycosyltransferase involved in cell wall biosynthesis
MRIAFVHERMLKGFGVDLVVDRLATGLAERGHDVTVYASVADSSRADRPYRLDVIPARPRAFFPLYEQSAIEWSKYIDGAEHDVVCVTAFPFFGIIPRLRTPAVAIDHGDVLTRGLPAARRANFAYMRIRQRRLSFPRADAIVAISDFVRSSLPRRLAERAQRIYLGGDHYPRAADGDRREMRRRLGLADDASVALYVGRLNPEAQPYKGTADVLEIASEWASRPDVHLVMAGLGSPADDDRIRDAGAIPILEPAAEEMPALYAAADVYLTASRWEGFDLPIVEAAYQGVPAVALRIGAHPEVVADRSSGVLVDDVDRLGPAALDLLEDRARAKAMGTVAADYVRRFQWSRAVSEYEELFDRLATTKRAPATDDRAVTAVVLNYEAPYEVLRECIASVLAQTLAVHVLLVDNGSVRNRDAVERLHAEFPAIHVLHLDANYGFTGGINRGIAAVKTGLVLVLNNDAVLEKDALEEMVRVIDTDEDVVGVAPKLLNQAKPDMIDAIGTAIDEYGRAHNVGIGQLDIGQYDRVEPRTGVCFAAALLRTEAFREGNVGPLDERFFMYYEDVDWCLRAGLLGYTFLTAPRAVVYHAHSYSARQLDPRYKQRLIMKNLLRTVIRSYPRRRWPRLVVWWARSLARSTAFGPARRTNLAILLSLFSSVPAYARARRRVARRQRRPFDELLRLGEGEKPFFDPVEYGPIRSLDALRAMYRRLYLLTGDQRHLLIAQTAGALAETALRFEPDVVEARIMPLLSDEPAAVKEYVLNLDRPPAVR